MTRRFIDTSVWLMAAGAEHPQRPVCRTFLRTALVGPQRPLISTEVIQEFLFHRMRRTDRATALREARELRAAATMHDVSADAVDLALDLVETTSLRGRDAFHVAVARLAGCDEIVSLDDDFAAAPGIRWVHPAEAA